MKNLHYLTEANLFSKSLSLYDFKHNHHVSQLAFDFANFLNLSETETHELVNAGLWHDVGKTFIPKNILTKKGALTKLEFKIVQKHPEYSYSIMKEMGLNEKIALMALHHHELYDGTGYPKKLVGDAIPFGARILCVLDNYSALTTVRPYRKALSPVDAINILHKDNYKFEPSLLAYFFRFLKDSSYVAL